MSRGVGGPDGMETHVPLTIPRLLARRLRDQADAPCLAFGDDTWTYAAFARAVARAAEGLGRLGVGAGDRVVVALPNAPAFLVLWIALAHRRAILVPVNPALRAAEMAWPLEQTRPALIVAAAEARAAMVAAAAAAGVRCEVVWAEAAALETGGLEAIDLGGDAAAPLDPEAARPEDVAGLVYTSGTTGRPKAAMQTQRNYVLTGEGFAHWLGLSAADRLLTPLPLHHVNAQAYSTMGAFAAGATLALVPRFSASRFWDQARRHRATEANVIGAMLQILWSQPPSAADRDHPLRIVYAAPVPAAIARPFETRFGVTLVEGFGMSECTFGLIQPLEGPRKPGSMGRPRTLPARGIGNEVRIVDDAGRDCPPGATGEMWIRNAVLMAGYYGDPEATAAVMGDGWLRTGDLARRDADGDHFHVGRKKEVIRRRGENIAPAEVEAVLLGHPAVREAAVIGVPSALSEEDVVACLVLREGAAVTPDEVRAFCAARLAPFKVPADVWLLDALPKTATERVQRVALRERWLGERRR